MRSEFCQKLIGIIAECYCGTHGQSAASDKDRPILTTCHIRGGGHLIDLIAHKPKIVCKFEFVRYVHINKSSALSARFDFYSPPKSKLPDFSNSRILRLLGFQALGLEFVLTLEPKVLKVELIFWKQVLKGWNDETPQKCTHNSGFWREGFFVWFYHSWVNMRLITTFLYGC